MIMGLWLQCCASKRDVLSTEDKCHLFHNFALALNSDLRHLFYPDLVSSTLLITCGM